MMPSSSCLAAKALLYAVLVMALGLGVLPATAQAGNVYVLLNSPIIADGYTATGSTVHLGLANAPVPGVPLTVVDNTGLSFIDGTFDNLAQGQEITLSYGGKNYAYVANYFGGTGNDLVLQWAYTLPVTWGAEMGLTSNAANAVIQPPAVRAQAGVLAGKRIIAFSMGKDNSVAVAADGTVASWGAGVQCVLGNGTRTGSAVPVAVDASGVLAGKTVVSVSCGLSHVLALCSDGTVASWGVNAAGQLGCVDSNLPFMVGNPELSPVAVVTSGALQGKQVVAVSAGYSHSLALCSDGTIAAWGSNYYGEMGADLGDFRSSPRPVAVDVSGVLKGKTVVAIAAGDFRSLALCSDGTLAAWGVTLNNISAPTKTLFPALVSGTGALAGKTVKAISSGHDTDLVLCTDGSLVTWGGNQFGDLGDGSSVINGTLPGLVPMAGALAGRTPWAITCIGDTCYVQCTDGSLVGWGHNAYGQLGFKGDNSNVPVVISPAVVPDGSRLMAVAGGSQAVHGLALVSMPGDPYQLPAAGAPATLPQPVNAAGSGPLTVTFQTAKDVGISAGGYNATGSQLTVTLNFRPAPGSALMVINNTGTDFIQGAFSNFAQGQRVTLNHEGVDYVFVVNYFGGTGNDLVLQWANTAVMAWGGNAGGQLGGGPLITSAQSYAPVAVDASGVLAGRTVIALSGGSESSVALCADGTLATWGYNDQGQLGNGTTYDSGTPVAVVDSDGVFTGKTVVSVAAGGGHVLALCSDGSVAGWGQDDFGQVGDAYIATFAVPTVPVNLQDPLPSLGTVAPHPMVKPVKALTGSKKVVAIAAGAMHSLALCSDGTLLSWGGDQQGQLGQVHKGSFGAGEPEAVDTTGILNGKAVVAIAAGAYHNLVLCADGTLAAWGDNSHGELGNGSVTGSKVPVAAGTSGLLFNALAGRTVKAISAGAFSSQVLCTDGTLITWGLGETGQLANGSFTGDALVPSLTFSGALAGQQLVAITSGLLHNLVVTANGLAFAWGSNLYGALGDSSVAGGSALPVACDFSSFPLGGKLMSVTAGSCAFHNLALTGLPGAPSATSSGGSGTGGSVGGSPSTSLPGVVGGDDVSAAVDLTSAVNAPLFRASMMALGRKSSYVGRVRPLHSLTSGGSLETEGLLTATVQASGVFSARLTLHGGAYPVVGRFDSDGLARFGKDNSRLIVIKRPKAVSVVLTLTRSVTPDATGGRITGTLSQVIDVENGLLEYVADLAADLVFYDGRTAETSLPLYTFFGTNDVNDVLFHVILPARDLSLQPAAEITSTADYPQGTGIGTLRFTKAGVGLLAGTLADGTAFSSSLPIACHYSSDAVPVLTLPVFVPLYGGEGLVAATLAISSGLPDSDISTGEEGLLWIRSAQPAAQYYPHGWPQGINTDFLGARFKVYPGYSDLPGLAAARSTGNALLEIDGGLLAVPFSAYLNLSPKDVFSRVTLNVLPYTFSLTHATGLLSGTFTHTDGTRPAYRGVVYQKGAFIGAQGYFLTVSPHRRDGKGESGVVKLSVAK